MTNLFLYLGTVLIWGTTWYAIKRQLGYAPYELSIFYRTILVSLGLFSWCKIKKISLHFKLKDHLSLALLGLSMFSVHSLFVYGAAHYIVSGLIAVIFSAVSFLSVFHNYIFFKIKPTFNIILGVLLGVFGLFLFFYEELSHMTAEDHTLKGFLLAGIGAVIFSFGSCISKWNNQKGFKVIPAMTVGMMYGALAIFLYILTQPIHFIFPKSLEYWSSLLYLVLFGSIIGFLFYLNLIQNIGPEKAGYTTVLFPIVALVISSIFETYEWSWAHVSGLLCVILGNILVMTKRKIRF